MTETLAEMATNGLHTFIENEVLSKICQSPGTALDLGAGTGALSTRLARMGFNVLAVDIDPARFQAKQKFARLDLNSVDFAADLEPGEFDLVTSTEVIEHLENPINFLRNISRLVASGGVAVLTTPNVSNLPSRVRFLLSGTIRGIDASGDPTHITPVFHELLLRQWLPRAGLTLDRCWTYPPAGFAHMRPLNKRLFRLVSLFVHHDVALGDNLIFALRRAV